jgi:hypothetical protein
MARHESASFGPGLDALVASKERTVIKVSVPGPKKLVA